MEWYFFVALLIAVPVILFPAAFVWYLNVGGLFAALKEARARKAAREKQDEIKVANG
jgi:hypothetical protein